MSALPHLSRRTLLATGAVAGMATLAACGSTRPDASQPTSTPTAQPVPPTTPATASGTGEPSQAPASDDPAEPTGIDWVSGDSSAEPGEGSALVVSGVRVGAHPEEGYDRVVVELTGPGVPGWNAMWVEQAHTQGKGEPIELAGSHTLVIYGTGATMALAADVPEALDRGARQTVPGGTGLIEADLQLTFEDQYQLTLGTETEEYRVFTLTEPTRLVVDVRRP
ncbi:hypothetical protein [Actinomyces respiraculi]|uniref:AMIN-like domain-containing (lipo)protein n=1 Tax=Actinomyces respiraculi TaxID=2744574 RepID=UPI0014215575|nr:hypothetical protein [Actinomyces respiraculi]